MDFESQKVFYNTLWKDGDFINRLKLARCIGILQALQKTNLLEPRIIDFGCGTGWLTGILSNMGPAMGVELSNEAVEKAKKIYPKAQFISANIFDWKYEPSSFDVVVSHEVIEHVEDQAEYLRIAFALLKPGGYLILTTPNADTFRAMPEHQCKAWLNQPIEKIVTIAELKNLISVNFKTIQISTLIHGYGVKGKYKILNSKKLKNLFCFFKLESLLEKFRSGMGLHIVALAQKS